MAEIAFPLSTARIEAQTIDIYYPNMTEVPTTSGNRYTIIRGWGRWHGHITFCAIAENAEVEATINQLQSGIHWTNIPLYRQKINKAFTPIVSTSGYQVIRDDTIGLRPGVFLKLNGLLQQVTNVTTTSTLIRFGVIPDLEPTGTPIATYDASVPNTIALSLIHI